MKSLNSNNQTNRKHEISTWILSLLSIVIGSIAGFGSMIFLYMIGFVHNLAFLGKFSIYYESTQHTPACPWGAGIIFAPVAGALIVAWLIKTFAPEAKGHGVPDVMYAIYFKEGKIRYIVGFIKAIASSISIGTGGSVGREGPFVQVGACFGSLVGQLINMSARQRNILIAAGAAGGLAATFNTPFAGLAFAIEILLVSINSTTLLPVIISTVTATYISRFLLGAAPAFYIPELIMPNFVKFPLNSLMFFIPFGIIVGLCSAVFIKGLHISEEIFARISGNCYIRHTIGMFILGIMLYLIFKTTGCYYIQGVGYATIVDILTHVLTDPWFLLLLVALKLLGTFLTLGSGASGGIFSPSLFLGAALGASVAGFVQYLFPSLNINPMVFALAGMAAMISATTGALLTGILMLVEMVHNMDFSLSIMITCGAAYATRRFISPESMFTLTLLKRGCVIPEGLQAAISMTVNASSAMSKAYHISTEEEIVSELESGNNPVKSDKYIVVRKNEVILGVLKTNPETKDNFIISKEKYIDSNFILFNPVEKLHDITSSMMEHGSHFGLVISRQGSRKASNIIGVITEKEILEASTQKSSLIQA